MTWWTPLLAAVVAGAFTLLVTRQYLARRRSHQALWAVGLGLYALASAVEAAVAMNGWSPVLYRLYFPAAGGLVGVLGAGTIHLLGRPRLARAATAVVVLLVAVAAVGQFAVPLQAETPVTDDGETRPLSQWGPDVGGAAVPFPQPARIAFLLLNILGGLALVGGALWSGWRTRAPGVLLIGVGALIPFAGGSLSTLGVADARVLMQLLGIVVMFAGYLRGQAAVGGAAVATAGVPAARRRVER